MPRFTGSQTDFPESIDRRRRSILGTLGATCFGVGFSAAGCRGPKDPADPTPAPVTETATGPRMDLEAADRNRPAPPSVEPLMRIRVARVDSNEVELGAFDRLLWVTTPGSGYAGMHRGPVRIRRRPDGWLVRSTSRSRTVTRELPDSDSVTVVASDSEKGGPRFNGHPLRGTVHLVPVLARDKMVLDIVCHVPMETYLPGVLSGELFESWRPVTHESLAIAARSFALCERSHWRSRRHFDVVAGERSQAWESGETSARCREAVERSRGRLLVHRGRVVPAYYSASCGGRPASALDAISPNPVNGIQPLVVPRPDRREPCPCRSFGPHGDWRCRIEPKSVLSELRRRAIEEGGPSFKRAAWPIRLTVIEAHDSGRPRVFRVESPGSRESIEISAGEFQRLLNNTRKGRPVRSADFDATVRSDALQIDGAGFGHGVGLCQYGCEALARRGDSVEMILRRYYPGATTQIAW